MQHTRRDTAITKLIDDLMSEISKLPGETSRLSKILTALDAEARRMMARQFTMMGTLLKHGIPLSDSKAEQKRTDA